MRGLFLHIGGDVSVLAKDVILILDLKSIGTGVASQEFLEISRDEGLITEIGPGEPKSVVLTTERVYLSPISSLTLGGRAKFLQNFAVPSSKAAKE
ncbi:extracellular matrix regulator RemB [Tepidanaerobacter acetatoxydans]|uniref:extracellular matrix regulator RemB n=1 Tax=Tepidanaerobacter acetatoxydans TaxID=499229 RepID=UPI0026EF42D7|nr:extracellular matrix/biofilm biosynthesis regulator RemA family protein [Tepidanaerobacter acetatoxydans]